jgi:cbb3-type cytochrome oxidase cytochrome c subunit
MKRRCLNPDCGAKCRGRGVYCSQTCRNAHESGHSRATQLKLEADRYTWYGYPASFHDEIHSYEGADLERVGQSSS